MSSIHVTTRSLSYSPALPACVLAQKDADLNRTQDIISQTDELCRDVKNLWWSQGDRQARKFELENMNLAALTQTPSSDPLFQLKQSVSGEMRLNEQGDVVSLDITGSNQRISFEDGQSWFGLGRERQIYTHEKLNQDGFVEQERVTTQGQFGNEWLYSWNSIS